MILEVALKVDSDFNHCEVCFFKSDHSIVKSKKINLSVPLNFETFFVAYNCRRANIIDLRILNLFTC